MTKHGFRPNLSSPLLPLNNLIISVSKTNQKHTQQKNDSNTFKIPRHSRNKHKQTISPESTKSNKEAGVKKI